MQVRRVHRQNEPRDGDHLQHALTITEKQRRAIRRREITQGKFISQSYNAVGQCPCWTISLIIWTEAFLKAARIRPKIPDSSLARALINWPGHAICIDQFSQIMLSANTKAHAAILGHRKFILQMRVSFFKK